MQNVFLDYGNPRILCTPEFFSGGLGVHLHTKT
jgi:hypothetical protein